MYNPASAPAREPTHRKGSDRWTEVLIVAGKKDFAEVAPASRKCCRDLIAIEVACSAIRSVVQSPVSLDRHPVRFAILAVR